MPRIIIKIVKSSLLTKIRYRKTNGISCIKKEKQRIAAEYPFKICVTYSFIFTKEEKNKTQINVIVR